MISKYKNILQFYGVHLLTYRTLFSLLILTTVSMRHAVLDVQKNAFHYFVKSVELQRTSSI